TSCCRGAGRAGHSDRRAQDRPHPHLGLVELRLPDPGPVHLPLLAGSPQSFDSIALLLGIRSARSTVAQQSCATRLEVIQGYRMQRSVREARSAQESAVTLDVSILSIATANPEYRVNQRDAWEGAKTVFPHLSSMEALYINTGIETRYSCVPPDWCKVPHSWEER